MVNFQLGWALFQSLIVGQLLFSTINSMVIEREAAATTVSTMKPSTKCSQVAKTPLPTSYYCGAQGRLKQAPVAMKTYPRKGMDACLGYCLDTLGCRSFSIDETVSSCALYNTSIESKTFKASVSNLFFWNPKCFKKSCSVASSSSSKRSSSTMKSSTITKGPTTTPTGTSRTSSASVPVTTIDTPGPGKDCVVPLPLSVRDCRLIQQELGGARMTYKIYFNGSGVVENFNNPGNMNIGLPSFTIAMKGEVDGCDAALECASAATSLGLASIYHSFDLHYRLSICSWECVLFGGHNNETSFFSVPDQDAFRTHGYTGKMKMQGVTGDEFD